MSNSDEALYCVDCGQLLVPYEPEPSAEAAELSLQYNSLKMKPRTGPVALRNPDTC